MNVNLLNDEKYAKVKRKLTFKMPVTFRISLMFGFLFGCTHTMIAKRKIYMYTHTLGIGAAGGLGLCYNDFYEIWRLSRNNK